MGVRPITTRETTTLRHTVTTTFRRNNLEKVDDLQVCAGQSVACQAALHTLSSIFREYDCDAILLVDIDNALNRIKQKVMLHKNQIIYPITVTPVINSNSQDAELFISRDEEITSGEGNFYLRFELHTA